MERENGISETVDTVGNHFKILFSNIRSGNVNKFSVIRDTIAEILCLNIETREIFHRFTREFSGNYERVKILTRYNEAVSQTFKVPIHLEVYVLRCYLNLLQILRNNTAFGVSPYFSWKT